MDTSKVQDEENKNEMLFVSLQICYLHAYYEHILILDKSECDKCYFILKQEFIVLCVSLSDLTRGDLGY